MCNILVEATTRATKQIPAYEQRQVWAVMLQMFSVPLQRLMYSREQKGKLAL